MLSWILSSKTFTIQSIKKQEVRPELKQPIRICLQATLLFNTFFLEVERISLFNSFEKKQVEKIVIAISS